MIASGLPAGGDWIEALLVMVLVTGAFVVTRKDLLSLVSAYQLQSLLLSVIAVSLYLSNGSEMLLYLAVLTVTSKVILIPYAIKKIQKEIKISRDIDFHYLSPMESITAMIFLILLVYGSFTKILRELSPGDLFYLGAVFGISLTLMGMLITFSRKKVITKVIGYLTMENGVLLFSLFLTELPFMIEVLVMIDLFMIVLLAAILSIGVDSSVEEFREKFNAIHIPRLQKRFEHLRKRNGEEA